MFNKMFDTKRLVIYLLVVVILAIYGTSCENQNDKDRIENMFTKRCDNKLAKDIAEQYDKCDAEASDSLKETVKKCGKEVCNTSGKFDKSDVCCYVAKPNAMFACFEKTVHQIEANEAKNKGEPSDDLHRKNLHNAAKIVECYEEIDDGDD